MTPFLAKEVAAVKKVVCLWMDQRVFNAVRIGCPRDMKPGEWIRLLIEMMVAFPQSSPARQALAEMVDNEEWGGNPMPAKPGSFKRSFRVSEDHWAALETVARRQGQTRMDYLRRLIFMGGIFRTTWYRLYLEEVEP